MEDRLEELQYKQLARMMKLTEQSDYEEVELRTDGEWSPKTVFRAVSLADVLSVETKLESSNDIWQRRRRIVCIKPLISS